MNQPIVLDLDGSIGAVDNALRLDLRDWQARVRFGCRVSTLDAFGRDVVARLPVNHGPVLMGSGDFHHLSWPLIARQTSRTRGVRVVVFDNHPDNMRYLFGIHCGSWVRRVALLPQVSHVHVVGITSPDIGRGHAWENYLTPLRSGKLSYWSLGVDTGWARWLGVQSAFRNFADADTLADTLSELLIREQHPTYLSIDKDVFSPSVVRTNWDQGVMLEHHVMQAIEALKGQLLGSDITGDVSVYRHPSAWKRWLSAGDGQTLEIPDLTLQSWQVEQHVLNQRLVSRLNTAQGYERVMRSA